MRIRTTFCLILCCLMLPVCSYAGKPSDKPPPSEDVEKAIQELWNATQKLEREFRRINGYQVLNVEAQAGSGSVGGEAVFEAQFSLIFCIADTIDCNEFSVDALVLQTPILPAQIARQVFTFDRDNSPDFDAIVEQLTNGNGNDIVRFQFQAFQDGQSGGASSFTTPEYALANLGVHKIAPSFGQVDLEDLEIGSISLRVQFRSFYDSNDDRTEFSYDSEVFFEMPQ